MNLTIDPAFAKELAAQMRDFSERRIAAVTATALTRTAAGLRKEMQARMRSTFDNPTPYTLRQVKFVAARANNLAAAVGFNVATITNERGGIVGYRDLGAGETPAGRYMEIHATGGQRTAKRMERALQARGVLPQGWLTMPGEAANMNAYGNQSVGEIKQILSWFGAAEMVAGSIQNMTPATRAKRRKGTRNRPGFEYFAVHPDAAADNHLRPGIYRRILSPTNPQVDPILIFVPRAKYRRTFDYQAIGNEYRQRVFPTEMQRAITESRGRMEAKAKT